MLLPPRQNGLTSLFEEVRVFKGRTGSRQVKQLLASKPVGVKMTRESGDTRRLLCTGSAHLAALTRNAGRAACM